VHPCTPPPPPPLTHALQAYAGLETLRMRLSLDAGSMTVNEGGGGLDAGGGGGGGVGGRGEVVLCQVVTLVPWKTLVVLQYCAFMQYAVLLPTWPTVTYLAAGGVNSGTGSTVHVTRALGVQQQS